MKAKKGRELVNELINDLLGNDKTTPIAVEGTPPSLDKSNVIETDFSLKADPNESLAGTRTNFNKFAIRPGGSPMGKNADASLVQSENLRIAQQRIFELEQEIDRIRRENEKLAAAADTIRRRSDELLADNENKSRKVEDLKERLDSEKELLEASLRAKDREVKDLKLKVDEYEIRLSSNLQKIRVRERELENRLELVKVEGSAMVRTKDEIILDMKRQIDQFNMELDNYRNKAQELNRRLNEKQEMLRRTVKALRLALSMLEGGDDGGESGALS